MNPVLETVQSFTLHPLADLFIATPFRLLWEASSHAAITARRIFVQISTYVCNVQSSNLFSFAVAPTLGFQCSDVRTFVVCLVYHFAAFCPHNVDIRAICEQKSTVSIFSFRGFL